jgi:hypothetical protein
VAGEVVVADPGVGGDGGGATRARPRQSSDRRGVALRPSGSAEVIGNLPERSSDERHQ